MKKMMAFLCAGVALVFLAQTVVADDTVKRRQIYTEKQTFRAPVVLNDTVTYGNDANIESTRRFLYPKNFLRNSLLGIWSGGTAYGTATVAGVSVVPDFWSIYSSFATNTTGVTRVDVEKTAYGTGSTVYAGFPHSMYIENRSTATGAGNTAYLAYDGGYGSGLTTARTWLQEFTGKRVVFGAWVWRDLGQYAATGITTNFIRPYIATSNGASLHLAGETSFAFGPYQTKTGWQLLSAVTTVPTAIGAFEVGFALNPTALAPSAATGDSVYVCAPFLLIDPVHTGYVPVPGEVIPLRNAFQVFSGGSTFGAKAATAPSTVLDIGTNTGWEGRIPDSVAIINATVKGTYATTSDLDFIHFFPNPAYAAGGVTIHPQVAAGTATTNNVPIAVGDNGNIYVSNVNEATGVSLFVNTVQMK